MPEPAAAALAPAGRKPLRIDFVFPRFKKVSGAERSILEFAAALARAGHRPRIVGHQFDPSCEPLLAPGVERLTTGARLDWSRNRYVNALFDYLRVGGLAKLVDPDADAYVLCGGPALPLGRGLQRRARIVYHCFEPPRALYQDRTDVLQRAGWLRPLLAIGLAVYRRLDRRMVRWADAITTVGPYPARRIEEIYGRPARPLTHGIDHGALDGPARSAGGGSPTILTVNSLHPRKRVDLALRALARLREPLADFAEPPTLEIVGDGPERAQLARLADELGVADRTRFSGFVDEADLPSRYHAARCYVHTAREESLGLSVIEAAYCRLPVVAVAKGGVLDTVVDGETGYFVPADATAIATAIERVLGDPGHGQRLGEAGRASVADRFTWERGATELLEEIDPAL